MEDWEVPGHPSGISDRPVKSRRMIPENVISQYRAEFQMYGSYMGALSRSIWRTWNLIL